MEEPMWFDSKGIQEQISGRLIDHLANPRNLEPITAPDGLAKVTGSCGDTIEISLKVRKERIVNISFWTDGCGASIACASMATELCKGKDVREAQRLTQDDIVTALGGLPEDSLHCALLASSSLRAAVRDYFATKQAPWKRMYRTA
jgi:nitrogen fixation NifU-like protein